MWVLWNSKVKFVSVSQLLGLALWSLFGFVYGPFTVPGLTVSLREKKRKKKNLQKKKPPDDFKPTKRVLLVFLDATGWGGLGFAFLPSYGSARMGDRSVSHCSQLPSLQPTSSMCRAPTARLCQAGAFNPPVLLSLRCTSQGQLTPHLLTLLS